MFFASGIEHRPNLPSASDILSDLQTKLEQGLRAHRAGRLDAAASFYRQVLQAQPSHPDAHHLLGRIAQQQGKLDAALACYAQAIDADPKAAPFRLSRGTALRALGRTEEAVAEFRAALRIDPVFAEAHHQLGNALKNLRCWPEAIASLREAARLQPKDAAVWLNLGTALLESDTANEAVTAFEHALTLEPARAEAHNILGTALLALGRLAEAQAAFLSALRLQPAYPAAHDNLGRLSRAQGRPAEAVEHFRAALAARPGAGTHSNLVYALNFLPDANPGEVFTEHRRWAELYAAPLRRARPTDAISFSAGRKLRIGYVSPDLIHHAVAYFIEPVLANHDRERCEIFCYHNALTSDRVTERLRSLDHHWRDIGRLTDEQVEALVHADQIDVLIDLAGHTARSRLGLFARQPAPVQVTWLGYPNTTGLDMIQYRITDAISDPPGETEAWHSERLWRMPATFSCYLPPADSPPVAPLPARATGRVTFGSFNHASKLNPNVIALWAHVLRAAPSARLFLRARALADASTADDFLRRFAAHGIDPARLTLDGAELSVADHLGAYGRVDIALDPFPYNGTTTTCEALWMGVPVITLAGRVHAARVGTSLLTHLGLPELVAYQPEDYVALCARLVGDLPRLAAWRASLRERMRSSSLCDAPQFTRHLEDAFRAMTARRNQAD